MTTSRALTCLDFIGLANIHYRQVLKLSFGASQFVFIRQRRNDLTIGCAADDADGLALGTVHIRDRGAGQRNDQQDAASDNHDGFGGGEVADIGANDCQIRLSVGKYLECVERGPLVENLQPDRCADRGQPGGDRRHQLDCIALERADGNRECRWIRDVTINVKAATAG
jgi:hypothetical protein